MLLQLRSIDVASIYIFFFGKKWLVYLNKQLKQSKHSIYIYWVSKENEYRENRNNRRIYMAQFMIVLKIIHGWVPNNNDFSWKTLKTNFYNRFFIRLYLFGVDTKYFYILYEYIICFFIFSCRSNLFSKHLYVFYFIIGNIFPIQLDCCLNSSQAFWDFHHVFSNQLSIVW